MDTSLWNFFLKSESFATAYSRSSNVLSTSLEKGGPSERDKLGRRRSTKLTVPPSSDARPHRRDRQALSTARFCRAGRLAIADTCLQSHDVVIVRNLCCVNKKSFAKNVC